jgi:NlpE C-terminal OB domain
LYRIAANVATFEDCVSGARLPVAQEGANVVLESAYLRLFAGGGNDPVLATIAGRVLPRPAPNGGVRNSLVVDGFLSLGGDACPSTAPAPPAAAPGSTAPPAPENTR